MKQEQRLLREQLKKEKESEAPQTLTNMVQNAEMKLLGLENLDEKKDLITKQGINGKQKTFFREFQKV